MKIGMDSSIMKGTRNFQSLFGTLLPSAFTGPRAEFLACRETAWLGVTLNSSPVFDIFGPDAVKFLNSVCVNRNFGVFPDGTSKHVLICNDEGKMLADGVMIKTEDDHFRTYWLAPVIHYYVMASGMDVQGEYVNDEYFFQIDGPKSLEILEKACQCDLHDIKFARNKKVKINGTDMLVHRLGMSGALAYEVHGKAKDAEVAYTRIREVLEEFGGKLQGFMNYPIINHTVGGYPNRFNIFGIRYIPVARAFLSSSRRSVFSKRDSWAALQTMWKITSMSHLMMSGGDTLSIFTMISWVRKR